MQCEGMVQCSYGTKHAVLRGGWLPLGGMIGVGLGSASPADAGSSPKLSAKERLLAFLVVYEPESLTHAHRMLKIYRGRERDLFRELGRKYGLSTAEALSVGACCGLCFYVSFAVVVAAVQFPVAVALHFPQTRRRLLYLELC
jgi:hypothetical protein